MPCGYCQNKKSAEQAYREQVIRGSIDYKLNGSLGNQIIYLAGREVLVTQEPLPSGLGGFTDTSSFITLAPDRQIREDFAGYGMPMNQHTVFAHEKRHFGIHNEYLNRVDDFVEEELWKVRADSAALDSITISYQNEPFKSEPKNDSYKYAMSQD